MVKKDDAVSPVIGVMLMLVVTLLIAGAVTLFATGLLDDTNAASATSISKVKFIGLETAGGVAIQNGGGSFKEHSGAAGLLFEVTGGDPVDLRNLKLTMEDSTTTQAGRITVTYNDLPSDDYHPDMKKGQGTTPSKAFYDAGGVRMCIYPAPTSGSAMKTASTIIHPGQKFLIVTEYANPSGMFGLKVERGDTNYMSGAYYMTGATAEKTVLTLTDEVSGNVLVECYLSDGVIL